MSYSEDVIISDIGGSDRPMNWPAAFAGALVAVAITFILMMIGAGLGLTAVSPWSGQGASAAGVLTSAGIALLVIQWIASAAGGYIAGRMRAGWDGLHRDETFFRDTVHGLVAWTVAALIIMGVTATSLFSVAGAGVHAAASVAGSAASVAGNAAGSGVDYYIDGVLRQGQPGSQPVRPEVVKEVSLIFAHSVANGSISADDKKYVSGVIANATGVTQADAEARIDKAMKSLDDLKLQAKQKADEARKISAATALLGALGLCVGAFLACVAAIMGGRSRDENAYAASPRRVS